MTLLLSGNVLLSTVTFTLVSTDAVADPTAVKIHIWRAGSAVTTYAYGTDVEVVKDSTGVYHVEVELDGGGRWWVLWQGTGAVKAAVKEYVDVEPQNIGR